jgi:prepilin-type N-terminal cleavage/methylation domain-containing protein
MNAGRLMAAAPGNNQREGKMREPVTVHPPHKVTGNRRWLFPFHEPVPECGRRRARSDAPYRPPSWHKSSQVHGPDTRPILEVEALHEPRLILNSPLARTPDGGKGTAGGAHGVTRPAGLLLNRKSTKAFTLIELMMVVAIVGLMMAMGIPAIMSVLHEGPLRKAVNDTMDIFAMARSQAILRSTKTRVVFHPRTGQVAYDGPVDPSAPPRQVGRKPVTSTQYDSSVAVEDLSINLMDYGASDAAWVFFYPNGTCDEMRLVLVANGEYRVITLEPTTALPRVGSIK